MRKILRSLLALALLAPLSAHAEYIGSYCVGQVIPIFFNSFNVTNGAMSATTNFATADIKVYKGSSTTEHSNNGFALIDSDGQDLDGRTGVNGFTIDTGDTNDAGFYVPGSIYNVVADNVTINTQTVIAGPWMFQLDPYCLDSGLAKAADGDTSSIAFRAALAYGANVINNVQVTIAQGAGSPDTRVCTAYDGATGDECTTNAAFNADPDGTSLYFIRAANQGVMACDPTDFRCEVNIKEIDDDAGAAATFETYTDGTTPAPVNVTQISGDSVAADTLESYTDGSGKIPANIVQLDGTTITCLGGTSCGP